MRLKFDFSSLCETKNLLADDFENLARLNITDSKEVIGNVHSNLQYRVRISNNMAFFLSAEER